MRPYWRYVHNDSVANPREPHKRWGDAGLTLHHTHPFWQTHYPPNGWGCRCRVKAVRGPGENDATEPPAGWNARDGLGRLPGIDRGWDYAPGANADAPLRQMVQDKLIRYPDAIGKVLSRDVSRWIAAHANPAQFAAEVLADGQLVRDLWLGFVGDNAAIAAIANRQLTDYLVLIPSNAVRHIESSHGMDGGTQRAPVPEDYASADRWLTDGEITPADPGPKGEIRIKATYRAGSENIVSVWEVRPGKRNRAVSLISMWVKAMARG